MPHCLDAQVLASSSHQAAARHSQQCQLRTGVCHQFRGHNSLKAKASTRRPDERSGRRCNTVTHAAVAEAAPDIAMRGEWKDGDRYTTTATSERTHANPIISMAGTLQRLKQQQKLYWRSRPLRNGTTLQDCRERFHLQLW